MAQILWTRHFLAAQGEYVPTTTIYQDNKSTILLAENGKQSSSRRTRHLNVRYFFVTDKIKKGEVKVAFCPMHNMLADFFTKPLQGTLFAPMQDKILNLPCSTSPAVHRCVLDLQDFDKGTEKKYSKNITDGQEIIGGENRPENAPAQKPAQKDKDTEILNKQAGRTGTSS